MRRLSVIIAIATFALAAPAASFAAPFPGNNQRACDRAGGTFTIDETTSPTTRTCFVNFHDAGVTMWNGSAAGYTVEVTKSDTVARYIAFTGHEVQQLGAIAITNCWYLGTPVANFLSEPNCQPTTLIP